MTQSDPENCRLDKWLWSVRIYKTRSLAADACRSGRVKLNGRPLKPARMISRGEILQVRKHPYNHVFKVLRPLEKRVSAKLVPEYMEDLTPEEEMQKLKMGALQSSFYRQKGAGRPTKRDRRRMDQATDWQQEEDPGDA